MKRLYWILLFVSAMAVAGCAHDSPQRTSYKAAASVITTVEQAMTGWGKYVVDERVRIKAIGDQSTRLAEAGKLAGKEVRVRNAYDNYLSAVTSVLAQAASSTNGAVSIGVNPDAESALIALIASEQL